MATSTDSPTCKVEFGTWILASHTLPVINNIIIYNINRNIKTITKLLSLCFCCYYVIIIRVLLKFMAELMIQRVYKAVSCSLGYLSNIAVYVRIHNILVKFCAFIAKILVITISVLKNNKIRPNFSKI